MLGGFLSFVVFMLIRAQWGSSCLFNEPKDFQLKDFHRFKKDNFPHIRDYFSIAHLHQELNTINDTIHCFTMY